MAGDGRPHNEEQVTATAVSTSLFRFWCASGSTSRPSGRRSLEIDRVGKPRNREWIRVRARRCEQAVSRDVELGERRGIVARATFVHDEFLPRWGKARVSWGSVPHLSQGKFGANPTPLPGSTPADWQGSCFRTCSPDDARATGPSRGAPRCPTCNYFKGACPIRHGEACLDQPRGVRRLRPSDILPGRKMACRQSRGRDSHAPEHPP
jgi:hypothetical protein